MRNDGRLRRAEATIAAQRLRALPHLVLAVTGTAVRTAAGPGR
ncbi:hypothetical protein ACFRMQ_22100 [Kitasatospora sp. NPDC056783]